MNAPPAHEMILYCHRIILHGCTTMSNARELALLEKWTTASSSSSNGANIILPLSSPTSPKATKFCCCPNRRRYNLKQPKLTTTLHVRNIFVDNDFNFIDDNDEDKHNDDDDQEHILNLESNKNYKRAESWPSSRRVTRPKNATPSEIEEVHNRENRKVKSKLTSNNNDDHDYDDIVEIASDHQRSEIERKIAETEKSELEKVWWRHDQSCHNNRDNCLPNQQEQHERNSNNNHSRCSVESSVIARQLDDDDNNKERTSQQQHLPHQLEETLFQQTGGNDVWQAPASATTIDPHKSFACKNEKRCGNTQNTLADIEDQIAATTATILPATKTSPLIQRLSDLSEFNRKETFSNKQPTAAAAATAIPTTTPTPRATTTTTTATHQHCNNCQFCFNQSCRNFSQLQKSLQDNDNNESCNTNRQQQQQQLKSSYSSSSDNPKMTITTTTNVANSFQHNNTAAATTTTIATTTSHGVVANNRGLSVTTATATTPAVVTSPTWTPTSRTVPTTLLLTSTTATSVKLPTKPSSAPINITLPTSPKSPPAPPPRSYTPSSPLTTTVIKTTMVKRSPANESTTPTTAATSPSATSASLTLEKSLAFITASTEPNSVHDATIALSSAKGDKPTTSKCLTDASTTSDAPLSVKERIAALVAGNEQIQKQHDNFINRTSVKNQCNKPMRSTSQNMTCSQRQHEQSAVINANNSNSNTTNNNNIMRQQSPTTSAKIALTAPSNDDVDGSSATKAGLNDSTNHKSYSPTSATAGVILRSSVPGSAATVPRCSLSNLQQHNNAVNKYGSNAQTSSAAATDALTATSCVSATAATASSPSSATTLANAMTVDNQQHEVMRKDILSNTTSPAIAAAASSTSSTSDTTEDNTSNGDLATSRNLIASSCRSKLAALDNLDLALNLSDLPLDVDDDDDPYFVLQEYLERVKHEINEVFELHKARQKLQQQQQQHQHQPTESDTNTATVENQIIDTLKAAVSNDELSRSTESDSGFDSATGGGRTVLATYNNNNNSIIGLTNGGSNKLPSRAKVTTTNEKENDNNSDSTRVMENSTTKNKQQQQQREPATLVNSKESKPPPKRALIPSKEQGKQELKDGDAAATTPSLPYSSLARSDAAIAATASSSTLKRLRKQLQIKSPAEVATDDVNMWANKFLRDLDNLMASDKIPTTSSSAAGAVTEKASPPATTCTSACTSPGPTSPMLLSAAATAVIQSRYGKGAHDRYIVGNGLAAAYDPHQGNVAATSNQPTLQLSLSLSPSSSSSSSSPANAIVLRPEKHATIPLQSFNLDCGRLDNTSGCAGASSLVAGAAATSSGGNVTKTNVAYLRTLSAPTPSPSPSHTIYQALLHNHSENSGTKTATCGSSSGGRQMVGQRNSLAGVLLNATAAFDQHQAQNLTNFQSLEAASNVAMDVGNNVVDIKSAVSSAKKPTPTTILKIEETTTTSSSSLAAAAVAATTAASATTATATTTASATASGLPATCASSKEIVTSTLPAADVESLHQKRLRQLNMDMDNLRNTSIDQSQQLSALMQQNHYCSGGNGNNNSSSSNNSSGNKHKTLMTTSSCGMPKKATPMTAVTSTNSSPMTCASAKQHQPQLTTTTTTTSSSYLLQHGNDATKKGSTSTIWTSEESILRSVGAVDEDNNSTSSSACEEASGVLSSGKSGISLDSSGVENDNNESGIGTATPPKDMSYWKSSMHTHHRHHHHHHHHHHHNHHHVQQHQHLQNNPHLYSHSQQQDNESVSSLEVLRKMKFHKGSSVTSSDDPDLLEVLSLCDETNDDDEDDEEVQRLINGEALNKSLKTSNNDEDMDDYDMVDEEDEGHDEFETVPYCDCDCNEDGDNSSASAGSSGAHINSSSFNNGSLSDSTGGVVLRRKYAASPIMVPQKCRSHSLDTSSLPNSYHNGHQQNPLHQLQQQQHPHQHLHNHHSHAQLARKLQHLRDRHKDRNQLSLALRQEPFQSLLAPTHFHELPSPSSASLHSGHEILDTQELSTKSNSAPLLLKQEKRRDDFANQNVTLRYSRSQSDRYLAEIEAVEACKWLRAAGFPQYAQMYEDHQFPIDLTNVAKDHTNLENDQLQSLYRRLCILNRCANMRVDQSHKAPTPQQKEDSDDENFALSENWTFQRNIRRWSRIGEMGLEIPPAAKLASAEKTESSSKESSPDRFEDDSYDVTGGPLSLALPGAYADGTTDPALNDSTDINASPLRRTGSERLKDGAKAILRRVESIKSRRRKRQGIVISGPQALDLSQLGQRSSVRKPDAVYSTPPSPSAVSPMHSFNKGPLFGNELKVPCQSDTFLSPNRSSPKRTPTTPRSMRASPLHFFTNTMPYLREGKSDDSSSYYSDSQESSSAVNRLNLRKTPSKTRRFLQRSGKVDDIGAHSDSECHQGRKLLIKDANANTTEVKTKKLSRGGSLNLGRDGKKRDGFRSASFRSRSTTRKEPKTEEPETLKKTPVVRWHSFQLEERPHMIFRKCFSQKNDPHSNEHGILFAAMSAGQLQMIRKLALVTLTGYMERYCPTHRSGWNWELPKFIKKIKMPDYKDKKVFGVPLLLILQRSGQTLPIAVRAAFRWLQLNALDQIGLFRKSGVKSRIQKLKELIEYSETSTECMDVFDTQQAYDVADMLKQYFRDLPESLLTTKMSETFAAIFQHLPPEVRLDAVQSAVLLLPDENREILYALLEFLTLVAANSQYNQMTANNLAVCLAPSLFHSSISTGSNSVTASPRRGKGKGSGVPDAKELFEAKASHECLSFMIDNYKQIYTAPKEKLGKCKFGYMEESKPLPLEALGEGMQFHNWRGYLYESTSATIKEGREKSRGWITITSLADTSVEIAYKKVGDGHPLRLWRCITEVEGPPKDVLDYVIRQRASWDPNLLQSQTIKKFDDCTEIFQYATDGQQCTDFCVLRSWRTDLPRGACVIVETSIDHAKAKPMFNAVRGVVLASRYLIEPCGSGRSRVMHLARVDVKGKTPEWYNKSYGHISSHFLTRIRLAFKNVADGPESKV